MNKFEQQRAERNQKILTEAKKLILSHGIYDGLMSELAVKAGISRQRLYAYYSNVDEVLNGIMEGVIERSYLARIADAPEADSPDGIIRYSILAFSRLSEEAHEDLLFLSLHGVYCATNPHARGEAQGRIMLFEKQIRAGQESGLFRTDKPLEELTTAVTHILAGYTTYSETLSDEGKAMMLSDELLNRLADMVLAYLKNDDNAK